RKEALEMAKSGELGYSYDDNYMVNTSTEEDGQVSEGAKEVAKEYNSKKSKYNVYTNNCTDACQEAIQRKTNIIMPLDVDPRPNSYFNKLKFRGVKRKSQYGGRQRWEY
ncbi:MAG: hypothetical protein MI784_05760, partial [Cytophagales bacterium]|nr:hypothetical protein [Cytophagales bacterium]